MRRTVEERDDAIRLGAGEAQLQHPVVDLSRCLGCATCVAVCPEDGVLEIVHGQAQVVNGARCVGVSACERECPVGAITVTLTNLDSRNDVPVVEESLEAVGSPGLYLAGEVTAHALIKTAVEHGTKVAQEVSQRLGDEPESSQVLDLCIVGAGPAGLACALEAKRLGLMALTLEQEQKLGGTVAKYPRRKLVMTLPVDLPLHGRMKRSTYSKEELIEVWEGVAGEHQLPIRHGEVFEGVERDPVSGHYLVRTQNRSYRARYVCLAIGRRGVPRELGIPGESLPKVAYSLLDAQSYQDRRVLVVGGGDSAVETALALAEQPGNEVTLSYRKEAFFRIKAKNQQRIEQAIDDGRVEALFHSEVLRIAADEVELAFTEPDGSLVSEVLPNDDVFVMIGGTPPFELLSQSGVSFDAALRDVEAAAPPIERGTGILPALIASFFAATAALAFVLAFSSYYGTPLNQRELHPDHELLAPSHHLGLWFGIGSAALILANLAYLLRRSPRVPFRWGSLQVWMTSHVVTGVLALVTALLHGAMAPRDTPGGHAFWALLLLAITGAIGRYVYAYVPRAANGRELDFEEVRDELDAIATEWDQKRPELARFARDRLHGLLESERWGRSPWTPHPLPVPHAAATATHATGRRGRC